MGDLTVWMSLVETKLEQGSSKEGIPVVGWRIGSGGLYQYKTISNYVVTYDIVCLMTAREVDHGISDT